VYGQSVVLLGVLAVLVLAVVVVRCSVDSAQHFSEVVGAMVLLVMVVVRLRSR
jgi:hypothetical protein